MSTPKKRPLCLLAPSLADGPEMRKPLPDWNIAPICVARGGKPKKFHSPQGVLERMPLHQKQSLLAWLTTGGKHGQGITYSEARARLLAEFSVKTNARSLCEFFQRHQRAPIPAVETTLSASGDILTVRINLSLVAKGNS